jgi:hypothetical protein
LLVKIHEFFLIPLCPLAPKRSADAHGWPPIFKVFSLHILRNTSWVTLFTGIKKTSFPRDVNWKGSFSQWATTPQD